MTSYLRRAAPPLLAVALAASMVGGSALTVDPNSGGLVRSGSSTWAPFAGDTRWDVPSETLPPEYAAAADLTGVVTAPYLASVVSGDPDAYPSTVVNDVSTASLSAEATTVPVAPRGAVASADGSSLPVTGVGLGWAIGGGLLMILLGAVLLHVTRRRV